MPYECATIGVFSDCSDLRQISYGGAFGAATQLPTDTWYDYDTGKEFTRGIMNNRTGTHVNDASLLPSEVVDAYATIYSNGDMIFTRGVPTAEQAAGRGDVVAQYSGFEDASAYTSPYSVPWYSNCSSVKSVAFLEPVRPKSTAFWFYGVLGLFEVTEEDLALLDTSNVTSMKNMFSSCSFTTLALPESFNTSSVTDMSYMFSSCIMLTTLTLPDSFDTSSVTNMRHMFSRCVGLTTLTLPESFDMSSVTDMSGMFYQCYRLKQITYGSNFGAATELKFTTWYELKTGGYFMFKTMNWRAGTYVRERPEAYAILYDDGTMVFQRGDTANPDHGGEDAVVEKWTGFEEAVAYTWWGQAPWYSQRENVKKVVFEGAVKPRTTAHWFDGMSSATMMDLALFDTSRVTNMEHMFANCSSLTTLTLPESFETLSVTDMSGMFSQCESLTVLTLSESFDTSNVTYMNEMFSGCSSLTTLTLPESFDTSNARSMESMFCECSNLATLTLPESFDTSNAMYMTSMFSSCSSLTSLTLPESFDTSSVTSMSNMFFDCSSLITLTLPESFDTSSVMGMCEMFANCPKLTLNCSAWDVSEVISHSWFNIGAPGVIPPNW